MPVFQLLLIHPVSNISGLFEISTQVELSFKKNTLYIVSKEVLKDLL